MNRQGVNFADILLTMQAEVLAEVPEGVRPFLRCHQWLVSPRLYAELKRAVATQNLFREPTSLPREIPPVFNIELLVSRYQADNLICGLEPGIGLFDSPRLHVMKLDNFPPEKGPPPNDTARG